MTQPRISPAWINRARALGAAILVFACATVPARAADSAEDAYKKALAREEALRTAPAPPLTAFRATVAAYEDVVLKFYASGYCDNALWQAAGVAITAYERFGDDADRRTGLRLLAWLKQEYPSSGYVKHVDERMKALAEPATAPKPAAAATRPATPPAVTSATQPSTPTSPPPAAARPHTTPTIRDIALARTPKGDRVTIELDAGVSYAGDRIANPDRVFVDLHGAAASDALVARAEALTGSLVTTVRCAPRPDQSTRVVLELKGHPRHSLYVQYDPFRVVIDLEGDAAGTESVAPPPLAAVPQSPAHTPPPADRLLPQPAPPSATSSGSYTLGRQLGLGVSRIVIDAGHGGHDPGAQANGITEAELTLDIAKRLQALLLERPGTEVVLTRATDEFISLQERTAIANREGADLFLSIHANASPQPIARGVETYFLNFSTTHEAEAVAARENETSAQTMGNLPELVKSITLNNKLAESKELADMVQKAMIKRLTPQNATIRDLGVKQAPFVVLIGAQMPSVLAEVSFLTNRSDAVLLKQSAYRQKIAQALFDAVVSYQASLKKVVTVAGRDQNR
jgi:N-acetylmuramoyl-L-alanine amidase